MVDLLTTLYVEDLGGTVATCGNKSTITAEAYTADHTRVYQVVDKVNIQVTTDPGVEDRIPVFTLTFELWRHFIHPVFDELVAIVRQRRKNIRMLLRGSLVNWAGDLRRVRNRVRVSSVLLRRCGSTWWTAWVHPWLSRTR